MMKTIKTTTAVRCTNIVTTKQERTVTCNAFLFELSPDLFRVRCPKCGARFWVTAAEGGGHVVRQINTGNVLSPSQPCDHAGKE